MKKVFTLVFLLAATFAFAQTTQTGYAKTKGRMDSNGNLISGTRIGGVSIQLTGGHSTVADANGNFTLTAPDKKFYLSDVQKQGYVLTDPDMLKKQYTCSSNPLVISMETPSQQQDEKLAAERKLRRQLQKQLQQKEDEIDALKEENKITEEEYRQALQKLYEEQESNEKVISDMAKRYAELDYDLLDEFYRKVSFCIENGDLVKADSLLRTRGDVSQQIKDAQKKAQAVNEEKEQLRQAEAVLAADFEELGRRCYGFYEKFASQFENDSAAYYLELRANLDTTNVEWQREAGKFIRDYLGDYNKAAGYCQRALRQAISQRGENHPEVATSYNEMAVVCSRLSEYDRAMEYHQKALTIRQALFGDKHPDVATLYSNIGSVYDNQRKDSLALEYRQKALKSMRLVYGDIHPYVSICYNNVGISYFYLGDYAHSLEYNQKALEIRKTLFGEKHPYVAISYNNLAGVYDKQGDDAKALEYFQKALDILKAIYKEDIPLTKRIEKNIASLKKEMMAQDPAAMKQYVYTVTFEASENQELSGEYTVLKYENWTIDDTKSLYEVRNEMKGKPTTVLLMKDNVTSQHTFRKVWM